MGDSARRLRSLMTVGLVMALWLVVSIAAGAPRLGPAPWSEGELSVYDSVVADGTVLSVTEVSFVRREGRWVLVEGSTEVALDDALYSLRSRHTSQSTLIETTYRADGASVVVSPPTGSPKTTNLTFAGPALDNDYVLHALRALPSGEVGEASFVTVVPRSGVGPLVARVGEVEKVTVPAGTFDARKVILDYGPVAHAAWYAVDAPHWLVRYENSGTHGALVLRRFRRSTDAPSEGNPAPPVIATAGPVRVKWMSVAIACLVQFPLMIVLPWWLARRLKKATGLYWNVWGWGALAFIASQVVHIPLNWAMGLLGSPPRGLALAPYPIYAAVVGLSAGVCEEVARYVVLSKALPTHRDDRTSLLFGAGHGGVESVIFGCLAGAGLLNIMLLSFLPPKLLGIPPEGAAAAYRAAIGYWASNPVDFALAGLERVGAISFHIMATHLVMRAVVRKRIGWLGLAILAHAILDGAAVACVKYLGGYRTSAIFFLVAPITIGITLALRRRPPEVTATAGA